jgi:hypothetical protein
LRVAGEHRRGLLAFARRRHYPDASHETAAIWADREVTFGREIGGNLSVS